jgi:hypothetical protein
MNYNDDESKSVESLLEEFKETVMRLRYLNFLLEDRLQKERGLEFIDTILFLDKKFKEALKTQREQQEKEQNKQEQEQSKLSDLKNNSNSNSNDDMLLRYQHYQ